MTIRAAACFAVALALAACLAVGCAGESLTIDPSASPRQATVAERSFADSVDPLELAI